MSKGAKLFGAATLAVCLFSFFAKAEVPPETVGKVEELPRTASDHWVWVPDRLFRHSVLFDGDSGRMLAAIDSGAQITPKAPHWSRSRHEIYAVDTIYSRGHRGDRMDFVVIYDSRTLNVKGEVQIPPRSADTGTGIALVGLLDGDRFLVVLNQSPGASVSVVDLEKRSLVTEVQTAGCAGVFPAGTHRFGMLCGDGTAMTVHLTETGEVDRLSRSRRFFDVVEDPVTEKGVRDGSTWWFVSFEGFLHQVDFGGDAPAPGQPWSLFSSDEREDEWRVGGAQHLAHHAPTGRLYSIVHQGGPGTHKDPGTEIWVYDLRKREKVATVSVPNLISAFVGPQAGFDASGMVGQILDFVLPNLGVHSVAVTQDDDPLLFVRHADLGAVGVLDARTGEHLRDIDEAGLSGALLVVP